MSHPYPSKFKEQAVQKALTRGSIPLKSVAQALGIGYFTLQTWIREYKKMNTDTDCHEYRVVASKYSVT